jgi:predicted O-linked N-acetylglucosamine transferase (SPINDLY family)
MTITREFDRAFRLHQQGKLREAFMRYDAVLAADPDNAAALHYSGVVLFQAGKLPEAAERIRASLAIEPRSADAWSNLAMVLETAGRRDAAANALREAAKLAPTSAEILANLSAAELALGRTAEAESAARRAIAAHPTHAPAWHNLALSLEPQGRLLEAMDASSRATAQSPAEAAYAGFKAQLEATAGMRKKARATLDAALARKPDSAPLQFQLAGLLERDGDVSGAMQAYANAVRLDPKHGAALSQLVFLRQRVGDWHDIKALRAQFHDGIAAGTPLLSPFVLLSQPSSRHEQLRCASAWTAVLAPPVATPPPPELHADRLRIGYLSGDLHTHATAYLAAGLFEAHDRSRFEIVAYSTGPDDRSPMRERLVRGFDRFVDAAGWPALRLAQAIRSDGIDILVDLKGHTEGAAPAVLALRPAPIQAHYLGYPGTLGGTLVDYLIGDDIVTPVEHASEYAETLVRLPGSYQINDRARPIAEAVPSRHELGFARSAVVLCCFNRGYKLNPEVFDAWMRVLAEVPDAVLWLLTRPGDEMLERNLRREMVRRGLDARRLQFASARSNPDYLALYRVADLFVDTWPYNAHTTASDALWAGCPVVTLRGETFASRVAASLLTAVGLPELIATSVDGYVAKAVALARDANERQRLRAHLDGPGRASALFDTAATTRALEAAYVAMAQQYRSQMRAPIRVDANPPR